MAPMTPSQMHGRPVSERHKCREGYHGPVNSA